MMYLKEKVPIQTLTTNLILLLLTGIIATLAAFNLSDSVARQVVLLFLHRYLAPGTRLRWRITGHCSGRPLKMKHGVLITDWHFWQSSLYSGVTPNPLLSLSQSSVASLSPPISLTHTPPRVYPSTSATRLTAIRHWPLQFTLVSPSPSPQLLPAVQGSGSLPAAKGT